MHRQMLIKNRLLNLTDEPEYGLTKRFYHRLSIIDNVLLSKAYGNVLEVGCGNGRFLAKLRTTDTIDSIWGVDISMESIKAAYESGFNVMHANGEKLPFKNEVFDTVMSANGSPKEMEWRLLLSEVHRVLKSNGFFAFDTYNKYPLEKIIKHRAMYFLKISNRPYLGISGGIETMKEFRDSCLKAGFDIVSLYTLFPLPFRPYGLLLKGKCFNQINTHLIGVIEKI